MISRAYCGLIYVIKTLETMLLGGWIGLPGETYIVAQMGSMGIAGISPNGIQYPHGRDMAVHASCVTECGK